MDGNLHGKRNRGTQGSTLSRCGSGGEAVSRSFKKNPIVWWRDRTASKRLRARLKEMGDIPDGGYYRTLVFNSGECYGFTSFEDFVFWEQHWYNDDEKLYARWMKIISK
jgi:hypothetical protein